MKVKAADFIMALLGQGSATQCEVCLILVMLNHGSVLDPSQVNVRLVTRFWGSYVLLVNFF